MSHAHTCTYARVKKYLLLHVVNISDFLTARNYRATSLTKSLDERCLHSWRQTTIVSSESDYRIRESSRQMKNRFTVCPTGKLDGPDQSPNKTDTAAWRPVVDHEETGETAAAYGLRRLVRFKIVGPLLIQADIIGGVCYLHTLVRALLVQDRITKKNMENLFGRS